MAAKKATSKASTRSKVTKAPQDSKKSSSKSKLSPSKKYDIVKEGNVYIRTLPGKDAGPFCEKMNAQAAARAATIGRKSYVKCEAVDTSENSRFFVRHQVREENEQGESKLVEKTNVFKKRQEALDFAHQIPNTPVTVK